MNNPVYAYGKNPLHEAILAHKRGSEMAVEKLYLTKETSQDPDLTSLIQSNNISYEVVTSSEIENMVGKNTTHQGICAVLRTKTLYTPLEEILNGVEESASNVLLVVLDELQDPHNVGAIIRSACAFGASAVLIPEHNQVELNATVIKAASGLNFAIPIVKIGNINTVLRKLKDEHFWIYGLDGNGDTTLHTTKFDSNTVIVVGSEGEGIRPKTLEVCDFKISIETNKLVESLNASNATAVTLYEWKKQN